MTGNNHERQRKKREKLSWRQRAITGYKVMVVVSFFWILCREESVRHGVEPWSLNYIGDLVASFVSGTAFLIMAGYLWLVKEGLSANLKEGIFTIISMVVSVAFAGYLFYHSLFVPFFG